MKKNNKHARGKYIRSRGNGYERQLAKEFRDMGWTECVTSRSESRSTDSKKVDLCFTEPFNIQAKCIDTYKNPLAVLKEMPDNNTLYNIVLTKVMNDDEYAFMKKDAFYELITMLKKEKII